MVYDDLPILNSDFPVRYVKLAEGCIQPKKHPVSRISQDLSGSFSRESSSDFKKKAWWVEGILHCSHEYCLGEIGAVSEDLIWRKKVAATILHVCTQQFTFGRDDTSWFITFWLEILQNQLTSRSLDMRMGQYPKATKLGRWTSESTSVNIYKWDLFMTGVWGFDQSVAISQQIALATPMIFQTLWVVFNHPTIYQQKPTERWGNTTIFSCEKSSCRFRSFPHGCHRGAPKARWSWQGPNSHMGSEMMIHHGGKWNINTYKII